MDLKQRIVRRFTVLIWGKACALCVLLMSLSDRVSVLVGFEYVNSYSFAVCVVAALAFLGLIPRIRSASARLAFGVVELILVVMWCGILIILRWLYPDGQSVPALLLVVYAALGRLVTLFINMQWNFHFSLNGIRENARSVTISVLLALVLFLVSTMVPDEIAVVMLMLSIITSGLLNIGMELLEGRFSESPYSVEGVEQADSRTPVSKESLPRTRLLYFGARVIYGIALGFLVSITSMTNHVTTGSLMVVCFMTIILGILLMGIWGFGSNGKESLFFVATLPILVASAIAVCFYSDNTNDMARLCAMLAELAWTIQNLFQLPSYRRMTGMKVATFAYFEYSVQIVPFYLAAWIISSNMDVMPFMADVGFASLIGFACLVILAGYSVLAMLWHIARYYPARAPQENAEGVHAAKKPVPIDNLTPREQEVFTLLAEGYSRPYIAKTLYISVDTVKVHARHIYAKIDVESQDELIEFAHKLSAATTD